MGMTPHLESGTLYHVAEAAIARCLHQKRAILPQTQHLADEGAGPLRLVFVKTATPSPPGARGSTSVTAKRPGHGQQFCAPDHKNVYGTHIRGNYALTISAASSTGAAT